MKKKEKRIRKEEAREGDSKLATDFLQQSNQHKLQQPQHQQQTKLATLCHHSVQTTNDLLSLVSE